MKLQVVVLSLGIAGLLLGAIQNGKTNQKAPKDKPDQAVMSLNQRFLQAKPEDYIGDQACVECHDEKSHRFNESVHAAPMEDASLPLSQRGCEGCHGPGKAHQDNPDVELLSFGKLSPKDSAAACLRCHQQVLDSNHWKHTEHAKANLSCITCHQVHPDSDAALEEHAFNRGTTEDPRSIIHVAQVPQKHTMLKAAETKLCGQCHEDALAQFRLNYHHPVPEGQLVCSDCHSPHPTKASHIHQSPFKSKCVNCHEDKAGPFVYEHDPVAGFGGGSCDACHAPHGSQNPDMLISRTRGLCAQCHSDKLANHHPGETCWSAGCHVAPHGSNTDPNLLSN